MVVACAQTVNLLSVMNGTQQKEPDCPESDLALIQDLSGHAEAQEVWMAMPAGLMLVHRATH